MKRVVRLIGSDALHRPALPVRFEQLKDPKSKIHKIARDLHATLHDFRAKRGFGRGIAAPQIGESYRIIALYIPARFVQPHLYLSDRYGIVQPYSLLPECRYVDGLIAPPSHAASEQQVTPALPGKSSDATPKKDEGASETKTGEVCAPSEEQRGTTAAAGEPRVSGVAGKLSKNKGKDITEAPPRKKKWKPLRMVPQEGGAVAKRESSSLANCATTSLSEEEVEGGEENVAVTLFNPVVTYSSVRTRALWDDCLSFPDMLVRVLRSESVTVKFYDEQGRIAEFRRPPNFSVCELLQHEIDHLNGITSFDRLRADHSMYAHEPSVVARQVFEANRTHFYEMLKNPPLKPEQVGDVPPPKRSTRAYTYEDHLLGLDPSQDEDDDDDSDEHEQTEQQTSSKKY